jgi:HSP20 family protein
MHRFDHAFPSGVLAPGTVETVKRQRSETGRPGSHGEATMKLPAGLKWTPPTDVVETEKEVIVVVEIAGMSGGDFDVVTDGSTLRIGGYRRNAAPQGRKQFHTLEIQVGRFEKIVELPVPVDHRSVSARYRNGLLEVTMAKVQLRQTSRKVPIT